MAGISKRNIIKFRKSDIVVYASPRLSEALHEVLGELKLYHGVRLSQVLEAVYKQGKKDGARAAFEEISRGNAEAMRKVPHRNPGKPRKV